MPFQDITQSLTYPTYPPHDTSSGYNPIFDESFEFQINLPELALVRFAVLDDDYIGDEFIGQYTIPFECMQTGEFLFKFTDK